MKLFSYHVYDKWTDEGSHGVVTASDKKKAEERVKKQYAEQYAIDDIEIYDVCMFVYGKEEQMVEIYQSSPPY